MQSFSASWLIRALTRRLTRWARPQVGMMMSISFGIVAVVKVFTIKEFFSSSKIREII
jgi:hypothetical protein